MFRSQLRSHGARIASIEALEPRRLLAAGAVYDFAFDGSLANAGSLGGTASIADGPFAGADQVSFSSQSVPAGGQSIRIDNTYTGSDPGSQGVQLPADGGRFNLGYSGAATEMTISVWIKPDDLTSEKGIANRAATSSKGWTFYFSNGQLSFHTYGTGLGGRCSTTAPAGTFQAGVWQHVAVVVSMASSSVKFYLNGTELPNNGVWPGAGENMPAQNVEFARESAGYYGFIGNIDTGRIYDRALTAQEVAAEAAVSVPTTTAPLVFAHYHMPCAPHGFSVEGYKRDILEAQHAGVDGFALNFGVWNGENGQYKVWMANMFEAARQLNTGFKLFLSIDGDLPAAEMIDAVTTFANHPNYYLYNGRPFLSTFSGQSNNGGGTGARDFWLNQVLSPLRSSGINVLFVPMFYVSVNGQLSSDPTYAQILDNYNSWWKDVIDGAYFPDISVASTAMQVEADFARVMRDNGKLFMGGVTPTYWGARQGGGRRYIEAEGAGTTEQVFGSLINSTHPQLIELFTWNDFTENTTFSPAAGSEIEWYDFSTRVAQGEGFDYSHKAFTEMLPYYIQWYKTGQQPTLTEDELFYFYRPQSMNATANYDIYGPVTDREGNVQDRIYVTTMLTSPATLKVTTGGVTTSYSVGAGMVNTAVPFGFGSPTMELWRGGVRIATSTGQPIYATATKYNYGYVTGFISATPRPDLVVTDISWTNANPTAGQPITFTATIRNNGTAATPAGAITTVGFWVDDQKVQWNGSYNTSIAPGQTVTITADGGAFPPSQGGHTVKAIVNENFSYDEADDYNDTRIESLAASGTIDVTYALSDAAARDVVLFNEGPADWAQWGLTSANSFNHKGGVTPLISNFTTIGSPTVSQITNNALGFSWSGGTPTATASSSKTGVSVSGLNKGFSFTVPADTTQRTLRVYVGGVNSGGKLTATLSDGSAYPYNESDFIRFQNLSGKYYAVYTINYRTTSGSGKTLTINWTMVSGTGSITLQAATLDSAAIVPNFSALQVNSGAAQRSMVTGLTVTFDQAVTLASDALLLTLRGGSTSFTTSVLNPSGDGKTYVLSFSGTGIVGGSLPDGVYDLTVKAASVTAPYGKTLSGADKTLTFLRLYGDYDGNGTVNNADYFQFKKTFGLSGTDTGFASLFDYDGNGTVNNADYFQFKKRFGLTYTY